MSMLHNAHTKCSFHHDDFVCSTASTGYRPLVHIPVFQLRLLHAMHIMNTFFASSTFLLFFTALHFPRFSVGTVSDPRPIGILPARYNPLLSTPLAFVALSCAIAACIGTFCPLALAVIAICSFNIFSLVSLAKSSTSAAVNILVSIGGNTINN
jgi:hypothetical protein